MDREAVRIAFINAAIKIGAEQGMSAITSRNLESVANTNQYYLYRVFDSVEDVILKASYFARDTLIALGYECMKVYEPTAEQELSEEECADLDKDFFVIMWNGFKKNSEIFTYYVRFYYNYVFPNAYSTEETKIEYKPLLDVMSPLFKDDTDIMLIIMMLMETLSRFARKVALGELEDSPETAEIVFTHCFNIMLPYLRYGDFDSKFKL